MFNPVSHILLALAIAALADVYTSYRVFKKGGYETNKLVKKLFGIRPAFGEMLAVKAAAFCAVAYIDMPSVTYFGIAVWSAMALHNWRVLRRE